MNEDISIQNKRTKPRRHSNALKRKRALNKPELKNEAAKNSERKTELKTKSPKTVENITKNKISALSSKTKQKKNRKYYPPQTKNKAVYETSAGGLVLSGLYESVRADRSIDLSKIYAVLICRLDKRGRPQWSLPKGHVENNDTLTETAEREVWEETGVTAEVFDSLGKVSYWFAIDGQTTHKVVHHYFLRYIDGSLNDEDPEVSQVAWWPITKITDKLKFADERQLVRRNINKVVEIARQEYDEGRMTPR